MSRDVRRWRETSEGHDMNRRKAESWADVPEVSDGYAGARDAIRRHVERLIERLQNP
jgi:hypothetical protein